MLMASFFAIYKNVIVYTIIIVYNKLYYSFRRGKLTTGENKKTSVYEVFWMPHNAGNQCRINPYLHSPCKFVLLG